MNGQFQKAQQCYLSIVQRIQALIISNQAQSSLTTSSSSGNTMIQYDEQQLLIQLHRLESLELQVSYMI